ncbi:MAG TPA: fumarylacetoacetate hydrolase family protein [Burkholderiaceae bacterium]|nr:fumarylacetoacetate hydrolase family protein [Burkholderiaceae bacterium]
MSARHAGASRAESPAALREAALALRDARARRCPIAPVSARFGIAGLDAAYAVAEINTQARLAGGRRVVGKKVGLTSLAVQQQLGVDEPDFGVLFDDMEFLDGAEVPMALLAQPKVEAEVAFVVGSDLAATAPSWGEFIVSLACALPAIEIVDSAIADWKITLADTVADNASSALYLLGQQPVAVGALAGCELGMRMSVNGRVASVGGAAACLGHPLRAAYWLARTMAARGQPLRAGELILSGALGPMATVKAGDQVYAQIGGLGGCAVRFV